MIVDLPDTTVSKIARSLVNVREEGGAVALGRVLTLVIVTTHGLQEEAIEAANDASREHPMRVIVLFTDPAGDARLDAQIRVGGDAGASEVIVLRAHGDAASNQEGLITGLLLPDAPVVAWWPDHPPAEPSASHIGRIAQRRITDAATQPYAKDRLSQLGPSYAPGDTDLAWTRLTHWREQLAAVLDQPPYEPVTSVEVVGAGSSPSTGLLAAWLRLELDVPVTWRYSSPQEWEHGIQLVRLTRESGVIELCRSNDVNATLTQPGQPSHDIVLPRRTLRECLAEELRRLDPDLLYGRVVTEGWELLGPPDQIRILGVPMPQLWTEKSVVVTADAEALASGVADRLIALLVKRSDSRKTSHIALTGGAIGTRVLQSVGAHPRRAEVDWSTVHLWWGDERFLPADHELRNDRSARRAFIDHIDIPADHVHAMASTDEIGDIDGAADEYAAELAQFGTARRPWPKFFLCFLGVGRDGHIAALFPDRGEIQLTDRAVAPVRDCPKPPSEQLTLTRPVINSARCVWLVVSGGDKAAALGLALAGASYETVPAAGAKGRRRTLFFVDEAAATGVPEELIDQEF